MSIRISYSFIFLIVVLILSQYAQIFSVRKTQDNRRAQVSQDYLTNIQVPEIAGNGTARYLAVVNAVGRTGVLGTVKHNLKEHFSSAEWSCIVFIYVDEKELPNENPDLVEISKKCSILRVPGLNWGHWLQILNPVKFGGYDRVAILLDDLFLPSTGAQRISIPDLLRSMEELKLSSISPSIAGTIQHSTIAAPVGAPINKCIAEVDMIEIFLQIFTKEAWNCLYGQLHYSNGGGWCIDKCYATNCQGLNAIDYKMVAYHLGSLARDDIPPDARADINFLPTTKVPHVSKGGDFGLCKRNKCSKRFDILQTRQFPLTCMKQQEHETIKTPRVMHTFTDDAHYNNAFLLRVWSDAWKNAGWDTRILTMADAMKGPWADVLLLTQNLSTPRKMHILKYIAMSTIPEGGWFSDPFTMPLHPITDKESNLPNDGMFTIHDKKFFGLLSAANHEWVRFLIFIVEHRSLHPFAALNGLERSRPYAFNFENNVIEADYVTPNQVCNSYDKDQYFGVRFSHDIDFEDIKNKGLMTDRIITSYATAWTKDFNATCSANAGL